MTGSVESAKDVAKVEDKGVEAAKPSAADLLKKAVSGKPPEKSEAAAAESGAAPVMPAARVPLRLDARLAAVATVALVVGTSFGLVAAPRERSGESLARVEAALDAGRADATRLNSEIERLSKTLTSLRESTDAVRADIKAVAPSLTERVARFEQGLDKKLAALVERVTHSEKDQAAPAPAPAAVVEKRAATAPALSTATSTAAAASTPKADPTQTASIADSKPKSEAAENWALRDVYEGIAMLEDRKRRLLEVAPGDSVPGVGRVEAIERRGRNWVVVTKQGVITPQAW